MCVQAPYRCLGSYWMHFHRRLSLDDADGAHAGYLSRQMRFVYNLDDVIDVFVGVWLFLG